MRKIITIFFHSKRHKTFRVFFFFTCSRASTWLRHPLTVAPKQRSISADCFQSQSRFFRQRLIANVFLLNNSAKAVDYLCHDNFPRREGKSSRRLNQSAFACATPQQHKRRISSSFAFLFVICFSQNENKLILCVLFERRWGWGGRLRGWRERQQTKTS